jgi:hypothetical protein
MVWRGQGANKNHAKFIAAVNFGSRKFNRSINSGYLLRQSVATIWGYSSSGGKKPQAQNASRSDMPVCVAQ